MAAVPDEKLAVLESGPSGPPSSKVNDPRASKDCEVPALSLQFELAACVQL